MNDNQQGHFGAPSSIVQILLAAFALAASVLIVMVSPRAPLLIG